jgi:hypothetical protein
MNEKKAENLSFVKKDKEYKKEFADFKKAAQSKTEIVNGKKITKYLYNTYTVIECNICLKQFNPNSIIASDEGVDENSLVSFLNHLSTHIQQTHPNQIPTYQVKTIEEWKTKEEVIAAFKERDEDLTALVSAVIYSATVVGLSTAINKIIDSSDNKRKK